MKDLAVFQSLLEGIAEEMGAALRRSAFSPNIRERLDFSCALFDPTGNLLAQAAHIPVHLGSMPQLMQRLAAEVEVGPRDMLVVNDPAWGGTHLPDLTLVAPIMHGSRRLGYAASRAHHADVGGMAAGSMPMSRELVQEGLVLPPVRLVANGRRNADVWALLLRNVRTPREREGDLLAQMAANHTAQKRCAELASRMDWDSSCQALLRHSRRMMAQALSELSGPLYRNATGGLRMGSAVAEDFLDDQGERVPIRVKVDLGPMAVCDFTGTAPARRSNLNAPFPVTCAAVYYCFLCLLGGRIPVNQGAFMPIQIKAPEGSLVNPPAWAAVAAGNVETSQRIVDVVFQALGRLLPDRVPACSAGTMNNLVMGGRDWAYYETSGGGAGACQGEPGGSGLQVHMTNTRNTPAESLESDHPLRLRRYAIRRGSGGAGMFSGGDGIVREVELLRDATVSLLVQRRQEGPPGAMGGEPGQAGQDHLILPDGRRERLQGQFTRELPAGTILSLETPGGGGWGKAWP